MSAVSYPNKNTVKFAVLTTLVCGNALSNNPSIAPEGLAGCSMTCKGNATEFCGAGNRLNVYKLGYNGASSTTTTRPATTVSLT